jgi:Putative DNA-binding domain
MPLESIPLERRAREVSYASLFSGALMRPDCETPSVVTGPAGKGAIKRYNVYRNNVTVSLIEALATIFPAVRRITGQEFFRAMARLHLRETLPSSPLLFEYGREFPAFIARYEYAQDMPWLTDVARIERAWLDAYHAPDAEALSPSALAPVPAERTGDLTFTPHPATRIVRSRFAAVTIFAANRSPDPFDRINAGEPEDGLITRPGFEVVVRHLPAGGADFLSALIAGEALGAAADKALRACLSFNIGAAIASMIEAGAFASVQIGDVQ